MVLPPCWLRRRCSQSSGLRAEQVTVIGRLSASLKGHVRLAELCQMSVTVIKRRTLALGQCRDIWFK